jgi:hypothetical protein
MLSTLLASKVNGIGKLMQALGLPDWTIWVFVTLFLGWWLYRKVAASEEAE